MMNKGKYTLCCDFGDGEDENIEIIHHPFVKNKRKDIADIIIESYVPTKLATDWKAIMNKLERI